MIVGALLGHSDHATTLRYAHLAADPVSAAAQDIGILLDKALNPAAHVAAETLPTALVITTGTEVIPQISITNP